MFVFGKAGKRSGGGTREEQRRYRIRKFRWNLMLYNSVTV